MTILAGLGGALVAAYVAGTLAATAVALRARRRFHPEVGRAELLAQERAELVLEPPWTPAWVERAGLLLWACLLPGLLLLLLSAYPTRPLVGIAVLLSLVATVAYSLVMQGQGQPLGLDAEGFGYGRGKRQRRIRWIHVTDLQLAPTADRRASTAVLYRTNRALVDAGAARHRYWDGSIRNAVGVDTGDLLDAMRFRQAKAMASAKPPIGRARSAPATGPGEGR